MHWVLAPVQAVWQRLRPWLKRAWYSLFRYSPHHYLGAFFWASLGEEERGRLLGPGELAALPYGPFRLHCLLTYLANRYYAQYADSATTPEPVRRFWRHPLASRYHQNAREYYSQKKEEFERTYGSLLARLAGLLAAADYDYVVELGCGTGLVIEEVAAQTAKPQTIFVGLDLNPDVIAANRQRYPDSLVQYEQSDTVQEFLGRARPGSALVFASGTLCYFTQRELGNLLNWLTGHVPRGALVVHDTTRPGVEQEQHSRPAGGFYFLHNYPLLLAQAGLENIDCQIHPRPEPPLSQEILVSGQWTHARRSAGDACTEGILPSGRGRDPDRSG